MGEDDLESFETNLRIEMKTEKDKFEGHEQSERANVMQEFERRKNDIEMHRAERQKVFDNESKKLSEFRLKDAKRKFEKELAEYDSSIRSERDRLLKGFEAHIARERERLNKKHQDQEQQLLRMKSDLRNKIRRLRDTELEDIKSREIKWRKHALIWLNE